MEDDEEIFGSAFNWCDNWCERCPLREGCPIVTRERQHRWVHEAKGEDPDDFSTVLDDVGVELARAMQMLEEWAEEEGIDLSSLEGVEPEIPSIAAERLQRTGRSYALALREATDSSRELDEEGDRHLGELVHQSLVIARKCARLAGYVDRTGGPALDMASWTMDAVPNLLLLEIVTRCVSDAVAAILEGPDRARFEQLAADLARCLAPLYAAVTDEARAELASRVSRRDAPSPFCIDDDGPER